MIKGAQVDFLSNQKVTQLQFMTMVTISYFTKCSMSQLAENMHMSYPQATGIVERLIKVGLLKREGSDSDRRVVYISLTTKGEKLIDGFKSVVKRRWMEVISTFNDQDLDAFIKLIQKMSKVVGKSRITS